MDGLSFTIQLEPEPPRVTHQQHRVAVVDGKPRFYDSPALRAARSLFMAHLEHFRPDAPFEGPIRLTAVWWFRTPARARDGWKPTKPDTDNLQKLLKDCLTASGFWLDDAQVVDEHVQKLQAAATAWHGIAICIRQLDNPAI